jgi:hypothetical protein
MCADALPPDSMGSISDTYHTFEIMRGLLNELATLFGFDDWVDAYHGIHCNEKETYE